MDAIGIPCGVRQRNKKLVAASLRRMLLMRRTIRGVFVSLNTGMFEQINPIEVIQRERLHLEGSFPALSQRPRRAPIALHGSRR